jgi:hypothetical protein
VIVFSQGKPSQPVIDMLKTANKQYQPKIQRGSSYKFMWLDANTEVKWAQQFQFDSYPQLIVLNPGRRKRFVKLEGDINLNNIGTMYKSRTHFGEN